MEKTQIEIAHEEMYTQLMQVRNLSDVYGFEFDANKTSGKRIILCGTKRRWGNAYKRFAVPSETHDLLRNLKVIIANGGKVFGIQ